MKLSVFGRWRCLRRRWLCHTIYGRKYFLKHGPVIILKIQFCYQLTKVKPFKNVIATVYMYKPSISNGSFLNTIYSHGYYSTEFYLKKIKIWMRLILWRNSFNIPFERLKSIYAYRHPTKQLSMINPKITLLFFPIEIC